MAKAETSLPPIGTVTRDSRANLSCRKGRELREERDGQGLQTLEGPASLVPYSCERKPFVWLPDSELLDVLVSTVNN